MLGTFSWSVKPFLTYRPLQRLRALFGYSTSQTSQFPIFPLFLNLRTPHSILFPFTLLHSFSQLLRSNHSRAWRIDACRVTHTLHGNGNEAPHLTVTTDVDMSVGRFLIFRSRDSQFLLESIHLLHSSNLKQKFGRVESTPGVYSKLVSTKHWLQSSWLESMIGWNHLGVDA